MDEITHKQIIKTLNPVARKRLLQKSDAAGLKQAALHLGLLLFSGLYIHRQLAGWPLLLPAHGIVLVFLFTAMHEAVHGTAFKTPALNGLLAHFCGLVLLLPAGWFRLFHFCHHRYTNIPGKDPELIQPRPAVLRQYLSYLSGFGTWRDQVKALCNNALSESMHSFVPASHKKTILFEARLHLLVYTLLAVVSVFSNSSVLLWLWLIPMLIGQPFLRAYLLAEHALCPHVDNMLLNSRTTLTTFVIRFIAWNMPYHAEHHTLPAVPFHKLPELHVYLREHLQALENGYTGFHKKMLKAVSQ